MSDTQFDLIVIGAGSGGVRAARMAAQTGARVAICERSALGGTCVNVGCVPKKLLVYGSHLAHEFEDASGYGWTVPKASLNWHHLIENKNREISRLNGIYDDLLKEAGVELVVGRASLSSPNSVRIEKRELVADKILIATGSRPRRPPIEGAELGMVSDDMFFLSDLPKRAVVVGAGYIGVEFASILQAFGSQVHLVHRGPDLLRGFDCDVQSALRTAMQSNGGRFHFNVASTRLEKRDDGLRFHFDSSESIDADVVLFATGRVPNTDDLGLDRAGVHVDDKGAISVDGQFRTNVESIFALGDVIGHTQLTPVAIHEAMCFVKTQFQNEPTLADYENLPTAVFSQPPIGTVGLTEAAAKQKYDHVVIYRSSFVPLKQSMTTRKVKTMMKLVVDADTDKVVGCHMVGTDAAEIVQGFAVALKCGATKAQFDATIGIHPTSAEEFVTMRTPVAQT